LYHGNLRSRDYRVENEKVHKKPSTAQRTTYRGIPEPMHPPKQKKELVEWLFLPCTYSSIEHICAGTGVGERDARCEQMRMPRIFKVPQCVYLAYKFVISAQHPEWKGSTASRRASLFAFCGIAQRGRRGGTRDFCAFTLRCKADLSSGRRTNLSSLG